MKKNTHKLWWLDDSSGERINAGVAFFDEKNGYFALRLNLFPTSKAWGFTLKPILFTVENTKYALERNAYRQNGSIRHTRVGTGSKSSLTGGDIHISFGPFYKKLVLDMKGGKNERN